MALTFAAGSGDRVDHGSAASLDNLTQTALTVWAWVYRTGEGADQSVLSKMGAGAVGWLWRLHGGSPSGSMSLLVDRATTDTIYTTSVAVVAANTWTFVAVTYDPAAAPAVRMYSGTLAGAVSEITSFVSPTGNVNGSGTPSADAAFNLYVGNVQLTNLAFEGRIERGGVVNRVLTSSDLEAIRLAVIKDCNVADTKLLVSYRNGDVTDYSGNGNTGTITGATVSDGPWTSNLATLLAGQRQLNQMIGR